MNPTAAKVKRSSSEKKDNVKLEQRSLPSVPNDAYIMKRALNTIKGKMSQEQQKDFKGCMDLYEKVFKAFDFLGKNVPSISNCNSLDVLCFPNGSIGCIGSTTGSYFLPGHDVVNCVLDKDGKPINITSIDEYIKKVGKPIEGHFGPQTWGSRYEDLIIREPGSALDIRVKPEDNGIAFIKDGEVYGVWRDKDGYFVGSGKEGAASSKGKIYKIEDLNHRFQLKQKVGKDR